MFQHLPDNYEINLNSPDESYGDGSIYEACLFYGIEFSQYLPPNYAVSISILARQLHADEAIRIVVENGLLIRSISETILKPYLLYYTVPECVTNGFIDSMGASKRLE